MADFKDAIILKDGVSKPLKEISKNAEKTSDSMRIAQKHAKKLQETYSHGLTGALRRLDAKLSISQAATERFSKRFEHINQLGQKIKSVGQGITVGVTLPVVAAGSEMVKAAADMQSMQQQLSTMLGDEAKGAKMFDDIKQMAAKTPFGTKDLMAATNTMLGFGISEKKVLPIMRQLGDISGGNAERFQSLALAFSQVSSAGKLQGQDLMQMINAGFNPLEAIAKRTGKTVGYWKEQMSKGKVTIKMVEQAMTDATSAGGRFYQMMEKQSKTALGQWSTFQDNLNQVLADFGEIILPKAIKVLQKLSSTLERFNSLSPGTKKTILLIGGFAAVLGPLITICGSLIMGIVKINVGLKALSTITKLSQLALLGWGGVIVIAIAGIIAAIVLLVKNWDKVTAAFKTAGQAIASFWSGLVTKLQGWISQIMGWLDGLLEKLGALAFLIPGLGAIKVGKLIGDKLGSSTTNNSYNNRQSSVVNNNNTTTTTNNYYGNNITPLTGGFYGQLQYVR